MFPTLLWVEHLNGEFSGCNIHWKNSSSNELSSPLADNVFVNCYTKKLLNAMEKTITYPRGFVSAECQSGNSKKSRTYIYTQTRENIYVQKTGTYIFTHTYLNISRDVFVGIYFKEMSMIFQSRLRITSRSTKINSCDTHTYSILRFVPPNF